MFLLLVLSGSFNNARSLWAYNVAFLTSPSDLVGNKHQLFFLTLFEFSKIRKFNLIRQLSQKCGLSGSEH